MEINWSPGIVMIIAAILRLLFLFRQPELSDDIYRYVFDGLQSLMGHNPYALAPADIVPETEELVQLVGSVNHSHLVTIYPPAAQLIFAMGAALGGGVLGLKALLVTMDLTTCAMLLRLLSVLGLPPWRAAIYAWHPLPVLEIAASGHIDGACILFLVFTLLLLVSQPLFSFSKSRLTTTRHSGGVRSKRTVFHLFAGLTFTCAVFVKLIPLVLLPGFLLLLRVSGRVIFFMGFLLGAAILTLPFLPDVRNILDTLNVYIQTWEFAGFGYRTLRRVTSSGDVTRYLLASGFILSMTFLYTGLYRNVSKFLRKDDKRRCFRTSGLDPSPENTTREAFFPVIKTLYTIIIAFLFFTPVLHPWYALYLVCLLPFVPGPAGLTLSWSVFLSYQVLIPYNILGEWVENDVTSCMVWLAPVTAFLVVKCVKTTIRRKQV